MQYYGKQFNSVYLYIDKSQQKLSKGAVQKSFTYIKKPISYLSKEQQADILAAPFTHLVNLILMHNFFFQVTGNKQLSRSSLNLNIVMMLAQTIEHIATNIKRSRKG